jgi:hypothetical protein
MHGHMNVKKNKLEKLVHLVGFIMRICHNARSHECKRDLLLLCNNTFLPTSQIFRPERAIIGPAQKHTKEVKC